MKAHECFHCKQWIPEGVPHDCWTTTEAALTRDLSEDLRDAWARIRETAADFGEQRIYASHKSIMFSRKACYFFVRPRRRVLEVWFFLGRPLVAPQIRKTIASSRTKVAHLIHVTHRDEVEAPLTDWLREAYDRQDLPRPGAGPKPVATGTPAKPSSKIPRGASRNVTSRADPSRRRPTVTRKR